MRIEDDLYNRQEATGLEGVKQFSESGTTIGNLSEDSDQDGTIEVISGKSSIAKGSSDKLDIRETGSLRLCLCAGEHARLDVKRNNTAG